MSSLLNTIIFSLLTTTTMTKSRQFYQCEDSDKYNLCKLLLCKLFLWLGTFSNNIDKVQQYKIW